MKVEIGFGKLKWWNLRQNRCPKCNKEFFKHADVTKDQIHCPCGFFISMEKCARIINDLNKKDVEQKLDQLEFERGQW